MGSTRLILGLLIGLLVFTYVNEEVAGISTSAIGYIVFTHLWFYICNFLNCRFLGLCVLSNFIGNRYFNKGRSLQGGGLGKRESNYDLVHWWRTISIQKTARYGGFKVKYFQYFDEHCQSHVDRRVNHHFKKPFNITLKQVNIYVATNKF